MFFASPCGCYYPIHWNQVLSREWRCSWSSADRRCSNYIWIINILLLSKMGALYKRFDDKGVIYPATRFASIQFRYTAMLSKLGKHWLAVVTFRIEFLIMGSHPTAWVRCSCLTIAFSVCRTEERLSMLTQVFRVDNEHAVTCNTHWPAFITTQERNWTPFLFSRSGEMTFKFKVIDFHSYTSQENPKMYIWCDYITSALQVIAKKLQFSANPDSKYPTLPSR